jgi:hypothetical protein
MRLIVGRFGKFHKLVSRSAFGSGALDPLTLTGFSAVQRVWKYPSRRSGADVLDTHLYGRLPDTRPTDATLEITQWQLHA